MNGTTLFTVLRRCDGARVRQGDGGELGCGKERLTSSWALLGAACICSWGLYCISTSLFMGADIVIDDFWMCVGVVR